MSKEVAAIIVTYNRKLLLIECIEALKQCVDKVDIYIIDNASTDGTYEALCYLIDSKEIKYYNTNKNIGGAGGFNYGIKQAAVAGEYSYFWLMDDDTIPTPVALRELLDAADLLQNHFGFLCSYVEWIDGSPCLMNIPDINKNWYSNKNNIWVSEIDSIQKGLLCVERATFVSFFVRYKVVKEIGLPIKEFFIWGDDTNYSYRISREYPSYLVSKSVVMHKMNSNTQANIFTDDSSRLSRYTYAYRNRFYNAKVKHIIFKFLYRFLRDFILIGLKAKDNKLKRWFVMCKGFIQGIMFNPQIEYIKDAVISEKTGFKEKE